MAKNNAGNLDIRETNRASSTHQAFIGATEISEDCTHQPDWLESALGFRSDDLDDNSETHELPRTPNNNPALYIEQAEMYLSKRKDSAVTMTEMMNECLESELESISIKKQNENFDQFSCCIS